MAAPRAILCFGAALLLHARFAAPQTDAWPGEFPLNVDPTTITLPYYQRLPDLPPGVTANTGNVPAGVGLLAPSSTVDHVALACRQAVPVSFIGFGSVFDTIKPNSNSIENPCTGQQGDAVWIGPIRFRPNSSNFVAVIVVPAFSNPLIFPYIEAMALAPGASCRDGFFVCPGFSSDGFGGALLLFPPAPSNLEVYLIVQSSLPEQGGEFIFGLFADPDEVILGGGAGNDPHVWGFNGQSFYFDGGDASKFHALVHEDAVSVNARSAPRYAGASLGYSDIVSLGFSLRQDIVSHELGIFSAKDACKMAPETCGGLPVWGVAVVLEGRVLGNGLHVVDDGLTVAVVNVPHQCKINADHNDRSSGMYDVAGGELRPAVQQQRRLLEAEGGIINEEDVAFDVRKWLASGAIHGMPSKENDFVNECTVWLDGKDLNAPRLDGLLTTVLIKTPAMTLRVEHWGFDVDEGHDERANAGAEPLMLNLHLNGWVPGTDAHGVLGQTVRATPEGQPPMEGSDTDYEVDSPFATFFKFFPRRD